MSRSQRRGAERAALDLVHALDDIGCRNRIVALARGFDGTELPELRALTSTANNAWRSFVPQVRAVKRELVREPVDIVLAHGGRAAQVAVLAQRGRRPLVVWQRILGFPPGVARQPRRLGWQLLARRVAGVVALNAPLEAEVRGLGYRGPVWTIPNFRDTRRFDDLDRTRESEALRALLRVDSEVFLVGFVGHLIAQKRPDRALDVLAEVHRLGERQAHLVVVGDGPLRHDVERGIRSRRLDQYVHVLGERADVERMLAGLDVFVLTSDDEGIPGVLIEAQLAGCCVVAPDIGGIASLVRNGETGMLAARSDALELATKVVDALRAPEQSRQIGEDARKFADRFSADRAAYEYVQCFETVLARRH